MKNRRAACFVPRAAVALAFCFCVVGGARGATQHDSDIEKQQYQWSDYTRALARRTDAVQRAEDIARNHPALLIVQGSDDTMMTSKNAVELRDALAPYYRKSPDEQRLRLQLLDGLSHGWADSDHLDELRRAIADWFNKSF